MDRRWLDQILTGVNPRADRRLMRDILAAAPSGETSPARRTPLVIAERRGERSHQPQTAAPRLRLVRD